MNNKLFYHLTALAAVISTSSFAGAMGDMQAPLMHAAGWVIGADGGYGYLSTQESDLFTPNTFASTTQTDSHQIGSAVGGGYLGYNFPMSQRLLTGLELGYKYLGESSYNVNQFALLVFGGSTTSDANVKVQQQAVDLLLTGRYFVWNKLNFIGKVGGAFVESTTNQNSSSINTGSFPSITITSFNSKIWRLRPEVAVGVGYSFSDHIDLNLMFTHINGTDGNATGQRRFYAFQDNNPGSFEYNGVTGGVSWTF